VETEVWVAAPAEDVWAVLADPGRYADWVTGTAETQGLDGDWPEVGARLRYTLPGGLGDETMVVASEPPRHLTLIASLGPVASLAIVLELEPSGDGTRVTMREEARGAAALGGPLADAANALRGAFSLERLKELAE
jgi:uncharacterized protein YndB with AHSA1/START domain